MLAVGSGMTASKGVFFVLGVFIQFIRISNKIIQIKKEFAKNVFLNISHNTQV